MGKEPFTIDLSPLYRVAAKMGIKDYVDIAEFEEKLNTSDGVSFDELESIDFTDEGLMFARDKAGNKHHITCHIKNQKYFRFSDMKADQDSFHKRSGAFFGSGKRDRYNVIHLTKCKTIEDMIAKDKFFKYHYSTSEDHIRNVKLQDGERDIKLPVCQSCLIKLECLHSYEDEEMKKEARNVNFYEFFRTNESKFDKDSMKSESAKADDYTKDWPEVSWEYKMSKDWICECCNVNLGHKKGFLHCHHINKRKADNREENLQALCATCHAWRHTDNPKMKKECPEIFKEWEKQNLPRQCSNNECGRL